MQASIKPLQQIKRKAIRSFLGLFSLSTMLFVFQACYGTPQDFGTDILIEGKITSQTKNSIQGLKVSFENLPQYTNTDEEGRFAIYCPRQDSYLVKIKDEDGDKNGSFQDKDTLLNLDSEQNELFLNISLGKDQ